MSTVTCKGCGSPLVTVRSSSRCFICGKRAGAFRTGLGTTTWTKAGAAKVVNRNIAQRVTESAAMTWQDAERFVCHWMTRHGYRDARLTASGADGGVDVSSRKAVAQVKHHHMKVGLSEMQRIYGIAHSRQKRALFFSSGGFTPKALAWARSNGVETYTFPPVRRVK